MDRGRSHWPRRVWKAREMMDKKPELRRLRAGRRTKISVLIRSQFGIPAGQTAAHYGYAG